MNSMNNQVIASNKRVCPPYYGASGTITGHLHWDPLIYPNRDGSQRYLFRVDTISHSGNPNNTQLQDFALMKAYVPAHQKDNSPFARLRKGSLVTVHYVVRTDTYFTSDGEVKSETSLTVRSLHLHNEGKTPPRPDRERHTWLSDQHSRGRRKFQKGKTNETCLRQVGCKGEEN